MAMLNDTANMCLGCCTHFVTMLHIATHELDVVTVIYLALSHLLLCITFESALCSKLSNRQLPYLLTFAAAKTHIQLYNIERVNFAQPKAVGPQWRPCQGVPKHC
ncbi:TPA: hypothetical protein ACH3X1_002257 [Trebouxia sp. C0004]